MQSKILLTGANGFVGSALLQNWQLAGFDVIGAVRVRQAANADTMAPDLSADADWRRLLIGRDIVVHAAARAHVLREAYSTSQVIYRQVNTAATLNLARQAATEGVRRFIFISTVGVHGLLTEGGMKFSEHSPISPHNPYSDSKWEAELGLRDIARETGLEVVILRPTLIYGPGVSANFLRLMQLVRRGVPLPFGAVNNCRSLLFLGNLVDAVTLCLEHPNAVNQTYLVCDGDDVSTADLVRLLCGHMNRPARLVPVPPKLLEFAASLLGKRQEMRRLLGSLVVDGLKIRRELGWVPRYSLDDGLKATVRRFNERA